MIGVVLWSVRLRPKSVTPTLYANVRPSIDVSKCGQYVVTCTANPNPDCGNILVRQHPVLRLAAVQFSFELCGFVACKGPEDACPLISHQSPTQAMISLRATTFGCVTECVSFPGVSSSCLSTHCAIVSAWSVVFVFVGQSRTRRRGRGGQAHHLREAFAVAEIRHRRCVSSVSPICCGSVIPTTYATDSGRSSVDNNYFTQKNPVVTMLQPMHEDALTNPTNVARSFAFTIFPLVRPSLYAK